jgi:hypothetical protein
VIDRTRTSTSTSTSIGILSDRNFTIVALDGAGCQCQQRCILFFLTPPHQQQIIIRSGARLQVLDPYIGCIQLVQVNSLLEKRRQMTLQGG